jgi:hypothetical protein
MSTMSKIIGFNADERMKLMAGALASRLGFADVSAMMRAILDEKIIETFSDKEREQLLSLLSPARAAAEEKSEYETPKKASAGRRR